MKNLTFHFKIGDSETTITRPFIPSNSKIKEVYYKSLKSADNSASFSIPFDVELSNLIKTHASYNTKVVLKDGDTVLFTGYLRKTTSFEKTQTNQPISLELVSPSYLLSVKAKSTYFYESKKVSEIVSTILGLIQTQVGITFSSDLSKISSADDETFPIFVITKDDDYEETLSELLFEYGYTYNFTADGTFQVIPLFNSVSAATSLNGTNLISKIKQTVKEEQYSKIEVNWAETKYVQGGLIFSDTTGATDSYKCYQEIEPLSYFLDEENNLCEYDSAEGEVIYVTAITKNDMKFDSTAGLTQSVTNQGTNAKVSVYNTNTGTSRYITQFDLYGNVYVKKDTAITSTGDDSGETNSVDTSYIWNSDRAKKFAKELKDYYKYADFSVSIQSYIDLVLGSFVSVTDTGIGTITGRIIEKQTNLQTGLISYTVEAVSDYTPATETSTENYVKQNTQTLLNALNKTVQSYSTLLGYTLEVSPDYVSVPCDADGNIRTESSILTFNARLFHGAEEITSGITKSVLVNGQGGGTWVDDNVSIPVSLFTQDTNEVAITFTYNLSSKTTIVNVAKLYQGATGESGDITIYQFSLSDNAVKVNSEGTMSPTSITAQKQMVSNNGICFTDVGKLYYYFDENSDDPTEIVYTKQTQSDTYDANKNYYKVSQPFMIALNSDKTKVLALKNNVAGVFWK